jgi:beta-lactamase class A
VTDPAPSTPPTASRRTAHGGPPSSSAARAVAALLVVGTLVFVVLGVIRRSSGTALPPAPGAEEVLPAVAPVGAAAPGGAPPAATPSPDVDAVLAAAADAASQLGIDLLAATVVYLDSGGSWSSNGERRMSFMSAAKFAWVAMATAEAGVEAAEAAAVAVFARSDNDAAGELIDLAGGIDALNGSRYPALGMVDSCNQYWYWRSADPPCEVLDGEPFSTYGDAFTGYSTSNDLATFLVRLWQGEVDGLDAEAREAVLAWATLSPDELDGEGDGTFTGYLPPAQQAHAHHKSGYYFDPYRSAAAVGIVAAPSATYVLTMAAYGGERPADQQHVLAALSCRTYTELAGDATWECPPYLG